MSSRTGTGVAEPAAMASAARRLGMALIGVSVPLAVGFTVALVAATPTVGVALQETWVAATTPIGTLSGIPLGVHVGVVGLAGGGWLLGLGLVLEAVVDGP